MKAAASVARPPFSADAVIAVPSESQVHKQVVRKSVDLTGLVIDPQFTLFNVDVPKAVLGDVRVA